MSETSLEKELRKQGCLDKNISKEDFEEPIGYSTEEFSCDGDDNGGDGINFGIN